MALIRRFIEEIWRKGRIEAISEFIDDSFSHHSASKPPGYDPESFGRYVSLYRFAFPDIHFIFDDLFATDDRVVGRWTMSVTLPPDSVGKRQRGENALASGITIWRIVAGKIVERWTYWGAHSAVEIELQPLPDAGGLDLVPMGYLNLDRDSRVILLNRTAQAIVDLNDGLSVTRDGLRAASHEETRRLCGLIDGAIHGCCGSHAAHGSDSDSARRGGVMALSRPSLKRPLQVLVAPSNTEPACYRPGQPAAAVIVNDPELQPGDPSAALSRLFGLTAAEGRFAGLMMQGKSLEEVSGHL